MSNTPSKTSIKCRANLTTPVYVCARVCVFGCGGVCGRKGDSWRGERKGTEESSGASKERVRTIACHYSFDFRISSKIDARLCKQSRHVH